MMKFSIIIPCYNAEKTIADTVKSIQVQTLQSLEIICIDDGSSDQTVKILNELNAHDPRVRVAFNPSKGPSAARNYGVQALATGRIISFCDADDIWAENKLEQLAKIFQDKSIDAAYGKVAFFTRWPSDAATLSKISKRPLEIPSLLGENPVCTMSNISVRAEFLSEQRLLDERIVHNEDLEWLVRLVGNDAKIVGIDEIQTFYRASPRGLSSDLNAMEIGRQAVLRTAAQFGVKPDRASEAIYKRYLARRSLRIGSNRADAITYSLSGLIKSPLGFFKSPRRGAFTLIASLIALVLPRAFSQKIFSR